MARKRSIWTKIVEKADDGLLWLTGRIYGWPPLARLITGQFHRLYYTNARRTWFYSTTWLGAPILKNPFDIWIYQELIYRVRPDLIIECGTFEGGSAYYYAQLCELLGHGRVITIDTQPKASRPTHPRLTYYLGSSTADATLEYLRSQIAPDDVVLVNLDSDHSRDHVLAEMRIYSKLVSLGSYLIVEDSNLHGHPVRPLHGPGPLEAIRQFLKENPAFEIDRGCEKHYLTFNPEGYLRRLY